MLALLLLRAQLVFQIVSDLGAHGRIRGCEEHFALKSFARAAERRSWNIGQGVPYRKQCALLLQHFRTDGPQRGVVIQYVDATAESSHYQVVLALLNREIANLDGRQSAVQLNPLLAADGGEIQAKFSACKQQLGIHVVFHQRVHRSVFGKVSGDGDETLAAVRALDQVRFEVAVLVVFKHNVDGAGVMLGGDDALDVGILGQARDLVDFMPRLSAIFRYLHEAVVRARVNQAFLFGRFRDCGDVSVKRRGHIFLDGVSAPNFSHYRKFVAIHLTREVLAHGAPAIAAIVTAIEPLRRDVDARVGMRADHQRRIPIPTHGRIVLARLRLNGNALASAPVETHQAAILHSGVNRIRIFRIGACVEAIAAVGYEAVGTGDAGRVLGSRRATEAEVVLRAAIDVVERLRVIGGDIVKLGHGKIRFEDPVLGLVEALVDAAVASHPVMIVILRIDPDFVIVDVLVAAGQRRQRAAAIVRDHDVDVHDVDALRVGRVHDYVRIVLALRIGTVAALPGDAVVGGAIEAAASLAGFDLRVDHARLRGRIRQADAAQFAHGHATCYFIPSFARIDGAPQCALRSAVNQRVVFALSLVGGGQQNIGIARVHDHVGNAGVFADLDETGPVLAAISGFVEAAIAAALPQGSGGRDVNHVAIARVDENFGNVLGLAQAHVVPGTSAIFAFVHAVAIGDAALIVILAGADPNGRRILGVDSHGADGIRSLRVEYRCPGGAVVDGSPDAAGSDGNKVTIGTIGINSKSNDTA